MSTSTTDSYKANEVAFADALERFQGREPSIPDEVLEQVGRNVPCLADENRSYSDKVRAVQRFLVRHGPIREYDNASRIVYALTGQSPPVSSEQEEKLEECFQKYGVAYALRLFYD